MSDIELVNLCESVSSVGALESSRRLYNGDATSMLTLFSVEGFNDSATTLYWQLFGGTAAPSSSSIPRFVIRVPQGTFSWRPLGGYAIGFPGGVWVSSTTPAIYTAGTASFWCRVLYMPEMAVA